MNKDKEQLKAIEECKNKIARNNNFDSFDIAIRYTFNRELLQSEKEFINKIINQAMVAFHLSIVEGDRVPAEKTIDDGRDFLGMPVANKSLLIPTIELKKFGQEVLRRNGIILPILEMGKLYTDYVKDVIKPKYESRLIKSEQEKKSDYRIKYEKCIEVIKRFDPGIIGMYDL